MSRAKEENNELANIEEQLGHGDEIPADDDPTQEEIDAAFESETTDEGDPIPEKESVKPEIPEEFLIDEEEVHPADAKEKTLEGEVAGKEDYKSLYEKTVQEKEALEENRRKWQSSYAKDIENLKTQISELSTRQETPPPEPPKPKSVHDFMPEGMEYDSHEVYDPSSASHRAWNEYQDYRNAQRFQQTLHEEEQRRKEKEAKEEEQKIYQGLEELKKTLGEEEFNSLYSLMTWRSPDGKLLTSEQVSKIWGESKSSAKEIQEKTLRRQAQNASRLQNVTTIPSTPIMDTVPEEDREWLDFMNRVKPD